MNILAICIEMQIVLFGKILNIFSRKKPICWPCTTPQYHHSLGGGVLDRSKFCRY